MRAVTTVLAATVIRGETYYRICIHVNFEVRNAASFSIKRIYLLFRLCSNKIGEIWPGVQAVLIVKAPPHWGLIIDI